MKSQEKMIEKEKPSKIISMLIAKELAMKVFVKNKWVVDSLFQNGTMNMLSAAPNNYKSWLTFDIAMSIATGKPLFGYFQVSKPLIIWIINEEDIEPEVKERMGIVNKEWEKELIYFSIQNEIKLDKETVSQIIFMAKERGVEFIIFDSLRSLHESDENNSNEMQKIMDQIKRITNSGITVLFTHHNRKKGLLNKGNNSEDSRGSTAIIAAVHSHISCEPKKEDGYEYLIINQPKLKGGKKLEPFRLLINLNGEDMPFIYEGEYGGGSSHSKIVERIIQLLKEHEGKGFSIKSFVAADITGESTLRKVLKEMKDMKSIVSMSWGRVKKEGIPRIADGDASNQTFYFLAPALPPEF
jgi:hypothetical protein